MTETIKVKLRNRVLRVPAEDMNKYIQQGYTVYDLNGNKIAEPPTDANKLKEAQEVIDEKDSEISTLTEQLKAAEQSIAEKDELIADKDAEIATLTEQLKAATEKKADATADATKNSTKATGKTPAKTE